MDVPKQFSPWYTSMSLVFYFCFLRETVIGKDCFSGFIDFLWSKKFKILRKDMKNKSTFPFSHMFSSPFLLSLRNEAELVQLEVCLPRCCC